MKSNAFSQYDRTKNFNPPTALSMLIWKAAFTTFWTDECVQKPGEVWAYIKQMHKKLHDKDLRCSFTPALWDPGTTSIQHAYWLPDGEEINSRETETCRSNERLCSIRRSTEEILSVPHMLNNQAMSGVQTGLDDSSNLYNSRKNPARERTVFNSVMQKEVHSAERLWTWRRLLLSVPGLGRKSWKVIIFRPQNKVVLFYEKICEGSPIPNVLMWSTNNNELKYECMMDTVDMNAPTVVQLWDLWFVSAGFFLVNVWRKILQLDN